MSVDEKVPVNSEIFLKQNIVPCDVYVKLNTDKFVKIINKDAIFSSASQNNLAFQVAPVPAPLED